MKIPDISKLTKKLTELIPKRDIEKLIFKILLAAWGLVIAAVIMLGSTLSAHNDIEKKIMEAAVSVKYSGKEETEIGKYEELLNRAKYPEKIEEYTHGIKRDPFSEYKEIAIIPAVASEHDFVLKAIEQIPLPLVYEGYIELPDRIIAQMNWRDTTRFVEIGSTLNGYRICNISKEKIDTVDENGEKIEFRLHKPVLSDELQAVLYDNITKKTFQVRTSGEIDAYKVIDIAPNYAILLTKEGTEIKLEK